MITEGWTKLNTSHKKCACDHRGIVQMETLPLTPCDNLPPPLGVGTHSPSVGDHFLGIFLSLLIKVYHYSMNV